MVIDPCLLYRAKDIHQRGRYKTNFYCYINTELVVGRLISMFCEFVHVFGTKKIEKYFHFPLYIK